ncbi:hypothetical protein ACFY8O_06035 [Streptomyces argenteolus]|uniref:Glycerophosphoryl diester phosphodiesterase family protein n=1 Tax=Streptomyces argenteolus TaxID=67274 RepID=A0ABW6X0A2_9ACTN
MTKGPATEDGVPRRERPADEGRGVVRTAFAVLRRDGRRLFGRAAGVAGAAGLGGLLVTAVGFAAAWPEFTEMRQGALQARVDEDSYAPEGSRVNTLWLILLVCLPFLILLLHLGCAAIQTAAVRAHGRFRAVLGVYALRGLLVWAPVVIGVLVEEAFTTTLFREHTVIVPKWEYPGLFALLRYGPPLLGAAIALLLRLGWTLAPAVAATEKLPPLAALRRSWSLVWGGAAAWFRTVAVALPLAALTVSAYLLLHQAARPLRSGTVSLFLDQGPDNTYAAYVAGLLAPIAVALLLAGVLTLPPAHTAFAVLHQRLVTDRERRPAPTALPRP